MDKFLLAHDLGTSGNKATLFSSDGRMLASVVKPYDTHYFNENHVEQNADDWWQAVCQSTKELLQKTGVDPTAVHGVSFSGQMMGCLCVDKAGTPLRPSIIWADSRAQAQVQQLEQHISQQDFYRITGHRNTPSYGVQKLMWVKDNEPSVYHNTYKVLNAKDYIVYKLTGRFYTDPSDANSMACFDLDKLCWSDRLCEYAGIDKDKLPDIKPSTFCAGNVTQEAAAATGLSTSTRVVIGGGDGVVANIGCGSVAPGRTYCCMGTSAWITTTSEHPIYDEQMRTVTWAHVVPGMYAPNGTMQYAGGSYSWIKNTVCVDECRRAKQEGASPFKYMDEQISQSPAGSNGVIFLPYLLGERAPRWDPDARGAFVGLKPENSRGDLLRSVLEGVTLNLSICLDILRTHIDIDEILVIGGGAKGRVWQQMMADIYGAKVTVPKLLEEAGSMGAAVIAGVGTGLYEDFSAIDMFLDIEQTLTPDPDTLKAYDPIKKRFELTYQAMRPLFAQLSYCY